MTTCSTFPGFAARLRQFMASGVCEPDPGCESKDATFNALALELFALQYEFNLMFRQLCSAQDISPATGSHWAEIPAVPTSAFKDFELTSLPTIERTSVFHSSGTTGQQPSRHFHSAESLALYEASLWHWFKAHLLPDAASVEVLLLTPTSDLAPHSSLVHMFDTVRRQFPRDMSSSCGKVDADGVWTLDIRGFGEAVRASASSERPLLLLGTAFNFVHLLDQLIEHDLSFRLRAGSRVLETGGYKGRSRSMPKSELHALITERLGVPSEHIICEYGMSELSSQAYDAVIPASCKTPQASRVFQFPPWARTRIVSPETGREVADGETGLIQVFDLANTWSVLAIQTEDLGVRRGSGFELLGRATATESRGCSLMAG